MESTETRTARRSLLVVHARWEARSVVSLTLVDESGEDLPAWSPGAHIDLVLPSGLIRQYSLCGDPNDRTSYTIAVLREEAGRGGSAEVHDTALVGRTLDVRGPRNHFALHPAPEYVFLAGGIGITPILPMIRAASACGAPWTLHYGGRDLAHMAFREHLRRLYPGRVRIVPQDQEGMLDLDAVVAAAPASAAFYCCGPGPMIAAAERACAACSPAARVARRAVRRQGGRGAARDIDSARRLRGRARPVGDHRGGPAGPHAARRGARVSARRCLLLRGGVLRRL